MSFYNKLFCINYLEDNYFSGNIWFYVVVPSFLSYNCKKMYYIWKSFYMDINNNKNEEVAFSTTYGDGNLEEIIFITGDNGKYEVILFL